MLFIFICHCCRRTGRMSARVKSLITCRLVPGGMLSGEEACAGASLGVDCRWCHHRCLGVWSIHVGFHCILSHEGKDGTMSVVRSGRVKGSQWMAGAGGVGD
jgi:hypothetical protein